ncbi:hypothetical protein Fleli_2498 [Bernardetia litoralis DSM 6794]|uniref:Uncharacterized protein n=1 Tax=Bernardetia litoralis (strain ATCC 23117 / DSM 6794 / NBRC 15988 / NCIMB 1366 / Fx l1 / Sio-4) TaxID=880071 RepID=I4ALM8_BERLS|nr:hypothetical protein Fleli_2498 [Bernardetia litoralis DSM 6794]
MNYKNGFIIEKNKRNIFLFSYYKDWVFIIINQTDIFYIDIGKIDIVTFNNNTSFMEQSVSSKFKKYIRII